jgi:hypothetical protein
MAGIILVKVRTSKEGCTRRTTRAATETDYSGHETGVDDAGAHP